MSKHWLVLDVSYLAWRSFHSTGKLSFNGQPTGVLYGFLRDVFNFRQNHPSDGLAFCFDSKKLKRNEIYRDYKNKDELTEEELELRSEVRLQIKQLREEILPAIGFKNICWQLGYEGDDMVASVVLNLDKADTALIIGNDHDLYQLISDRVSIFHPTPKITIDLKSFSSTYGLTPAEWVDVKAIAGCSGDNVPGVEGVGEITACKYLMGRLKESSKTVRKIEANQDTVERNRRLVKLPFEGAKAIKLQPDIISLSAWDKVLQKLGMGSLRKLMHNSQSTLF